MNLRPDHHTAQGKPILKAHIEEAQRNTNSNAAAAKWLGVSYKHYKRYAQLYGLFDQHLNPTGVGTDKGFSKNPTSTPLREILEGKHPDYSLAKLKNRLIARKKLKAACTLCGFKEQRITDGKVPLMITFKDGNHKNFRLDNLALLCYNCMFLTTGAPNVVNKKHIHNSYYHPDKIPARQMIEPTLADQHDPEDHQLWDMTITEEEREQLLREINESSYSHDGE